EHRAERWVECGDVPVDAAGDQPREMRHFALGKQGVDNFPIGRIPADQEETLQAAWRVLRHRRSPTAPRANAASPVETAVDVSGVPTPASSNAPESSYAQSWMRRSGPNSGLSPNCPLIENERWIQP